VQIYAIEGERCLSGDNLRDKILENYGFTDKSDQMKKSQTTISDKISGGLSF
jgi:hypothetical protein